MSGLATGDQMTGWSSAEKPGSAGKSQPPAMLDVIRKGKMPGALRYKVIETGLIGRVTAQAFPGDALNGQRIVEFILVLVSPAGCIRLHAPLLVETAQVERERIAAPLPRWKPEQRHGVML